MFSLELKGIFRRHFLHCVQKNYPPSFTTDFSIKPNPCYRRPKPTDYWSWVLSRSFVHGKEQPLIDKGVCRKISRGGGQQKKQDRKKEHH